MWRWRNKYDISFGSFEGHSVFYFSYQLELPVANRHPPGTVPTIIEEFKKGLRHEIFEMSSTCGIQMQRFLKDQDTVPLYI
jgi:hypothetical protein